jgi:GT2 family glycosyltransferase
VPQLRLKQPKTEKRALVEQGPAEHPEAEPAPPPVKVTALVVSHNRVDLLRRSIQALERSEEREKLEILVVDNGSTDGSAEIESEFPGARFIRMPRNFGLTKAINVGVRGAAGEYVLFLHEDTEVSPETARVLASLLENQSEIGAACPLLITPGGVPAPQIEALPAPGHTNLAWRAADPAAGDQAVDYARGAALMIRSFSLRALRKIDERYGNYGSDAELCFQVRRAGKRVLVVPSTRVIHHTRTLADPKERALRDADFQHGMAAYLGKHYGFIRGIVFRIALVLGAFGGLLSLRDFRYHLSLFNLLWSGQKIDGSQRD